MTARRFVIASVLLAACSTFDAASEGPGDGGVDGGSSVDAGPADSEGTADASGDATPPKGCAGRPVGPAHFCDDFDQGGDVDFRWQRLGEDGGVVGETDAAFSPPRALAVGFPQGVQSARAMWLIHKRDSTLDFADKKRIALSFAFKVTKAPFPTGTNGYLNTAVLTFDPLTCSGNSSRSVELNLLSNGTYGAALKGLVKGTCESNNADYADLPAPFGIVYFQQDFRRVVLEIRRNACTGTTGKASMTVAIDGISSECKTLQIDPFVFTGRLDVNVGARAGQAEGPTELVFDDVALDVE